VGNEKQGLGAKGACLATAPGSIGEFVMRLKETLPTRVPKLRATLNAVKHRLRMTDEFGIQINFEKILFFDEQCGNLYENKGRLWKTPGEAGMYLKTKEIFKFCHRAIGSSGHSGPMAQ